jgi:type II secretory pathway predicted ATPase ExeA
VIRSAEADRSLLARRWGATAVPFGLVNAQDWLDTPAAQAARTAVSHTAALRSVLLLDEAQNLGSASLEEVRLLLGLNLPEQPAFALILIGDEYLLNTLKLRPQRARYSRLAGHVSLPVWTPAQCTQCLLQGLSAVGLSPGALEPAASDLLASASGGVPRSLCLLARAAGIAAATQVAQRITPAHVQAALQAVPCVPGLLPPASPSPADAHV